MLKTVNYIKIPCIKINLVNLFYIEEKEFQIISSFISQKILFYTLCSPTILVVFFKNIITCRIRSTEHNEEYKKRRGAGENGENKYIKKYKVITYQVL